MATKKKAIILLLITALLWSSAGLLIKGLEWTGPSIACLRSFTAAIFIMIYMKRIPKFYFELNFIRVSVVYAGAITVFILATKLTTAANAILLQYCAPVYVALLAPWLLKEKTYAKDWFFICLAGVGMVLFFMDSLSDSGLKGNILAVFSGVFFALLTVLIRFLPAGKTTDAILYGNILAGLCFLPFVDWSTFPGIYGLIHLLVMGAVLGLAYYLYSLATPHLSALEIILIPAMEPILNPLWVGLFIGEIPSFWSIIGGIIVLTVITIWSILKAKRTEPKETLT